MRIRKAGEPEILEQPLFGTEKFLVETFEVASDFEFVSDVENVSDEQTAFDCWNEFAERLEGLEKRADKPTFPMEYSSSELDTVRGEVSKLAELGRIYLRLAYVKYLLAVGLSVDDANFLADSLYASKQNIYEKVEHAEWAFRSRNLLAI